VVAAAAARGQATRSTRASRSGTGGNNNGGNNNGGNNNGGNNNENNNGGSGEDAYLEQLRLARVEAFEARKALAKRNDEARGWGGRGGGLERSGRIDPSGTSGTSAVAVQQQYVGGGGDGGGGGSTSQQVMRRKRAQRDKEREEHEERLKEARRVAFEERKALEAKMRNGGRTPGR
jgi:hypothetical protein